MKFLEQFWGWLNCLGGIHDWTSKAQQGIKPTEEELSRGLAGFDSYATMYCARCGEVYKP